MRTPTARLAIVALSVFLVSGRLRAQSDPRPSDPRIKAELLIREPNAKARAPIIVDVYIENLDKSDIRKNQFSPVSSSVGSPSIYIARASSAEVQGFAPGLFTDRPNAWDDWYQPASGRKAFQVGDFILSSRARVHLLHGDIRQMVEEAGAYCRQQLANEKSWPPDSAATKKEYQDTVRFAESFRSGGDFDVSVWAYAKSNTVRVRAERVP